MMTAAAMLSREGKQRGVRDKDDALTLFNSLKLRCSQIESPDLIFLHIPFMWTVAFIQYSLE